MATLEHPTPAQQHLLAELDNLHLPPGELAEAIHALAARVVYSPREPSFHQTADAVVITVSGATPDPHAAALNSLADQYQRSAKALGAAMAAIQSSPSPQLARSLQSAENIWRRTEHEFGMLTSKEVAELTGSRKPSRTPAANLRAEGAIVGIMRGNSYRFPGFQFDKARGAVRPVMANLITLARDNGRSDEDLVFWMTSPSSFFHEEDRPVDHLDEEERVIAAAQDQFEGTW
jgi:hypothetical protein